MNDALSVLIWVQTVCKGYQQTTKVAASKERGEPFTLCLLKMSKYILWQTVICGISSGYTLFAKTNTCILLRENN